MLWRPDNKYALSCYRMLHTRNKIYQRINCAIPVPVGVTDTDEIKIKILCTRTRMMTNDENDEQYSKNSYILLTENHWICFFLAFFFWLNYYPQLGEKFILFFTYKVERLTLFCILLPDIYINQSRFIAVHCCVTIPMISLISSEPFTFNRCCCCCCSPV